MLRARARIGGISHSQAAVSARGRLRTLGRHFASSGEADAVIDLGGGVLVRRRRPRHPRLVPQGFMPRDGRAIPEVF